MLLVKYSINGDFRSSCHAVHCWIIQKIKNIDFLFNNYIKLSDMIYGYASRGMRG